MDINEETLTRLKDAVGATEKIADIALLASLKRTQKWLKTRVKRRVAKAANVPPRAVAARIKLGNPAKGRPKARLWIGLNAIAAGKGGKVSGATPGSNKGGGNQAGVKVGKLRFPKSFIFYGTGTFPRVVRRTTTSKYPLENVTIPISDKIEKDIVSRFWPDAQEFLLDEFERQMRWRMQKIEAK